MLTLRDTNLLQIRMMQESGLSEEQWICRFSIKFRECICMGEINFDRIKIILYMVN